MLRCKTPMVTDGTVVIVNINGAEVSQITILVVLQEQVHTVPAGY